MIAEKTIADYLLIAFISGTLGAVAMEIVMSWIGRAQWAKGSMIVALGSLFTRRRENAFATGCAIHLISALGFALLYNLLMLRLGVAYFPAAFFVGIGFGVFHGLMVSLALVWVVAEQHPLDEFKDAGFAVGVRHLAGHAAYGAVVGLVIAVMTAI